MWFNIIKTIPANTKVHIDELMSDGKKRSANDIIDKLFDRIDEINAAKKGPIRTGRLSIPSKQELGSYFSRSYKYKSENQRQQAGGRHRKITYYWKV